MSDAPLRILTWYNQAYEGHEALAKVNHQGNTVEVGVLNKQRIDCQHNNDTDERQIENRVVAECLMLLSLQKLRD